MKRRHILTCAGAVPLLLAGCASPPTATRWYELKSEPPEAVPAPRPGDGTVWELSGRLPLPGTLERDTLVVASGAAGVVPLAGHRWVVPLRDSVPARLAADLALLRGEGLAWLSPAPAGVVVARRLRVAIDTLVADEARQTLSLRARWWFTDAAASATTPPTTGSANIDIALPDRSADALAAAHRMALWRLAQRIAGTP
jgi:uncharacterized lipoprotein YmbA